MIDTNAVIKAYLAEDSGLSAIVGTRIYCPRLPENAPIPALAFFSRGGTNNPHIPLIPEPSVQFDCWGSTPIVARSVYRALYDCLQGLQNATVTIGSTTYYIMSAIEEVHGQDIQPEEYQEYHRVLTFFRFMLR